MESPQKKRVYYIDCLRVFAALLVVAVHCNFAPEQAENKIWTQILGVIGSPSSELFLAISGSLLIPVKVSEKEFYKKRFSKLLPPFIFWYLFGVWFSVAIKGVPSKEIPFMLFSMPFKDNAVGPFWFIYVIAGMYLIAPILTPWILQSNAKKIRFFLYLWGISLIMPYANFIYDNFHDLGGSINSPLYMFSGYIGYMMLGYYLRKYEVPIKSPLLNALIFLLTLVPICIVGLKAPQHRVLVMYNLQLLSAIQVITLFSLFKILFDKDNCFTAFCRKITNYTFGCFLIHTFVIGFIWRAIGGHEIYPAYIMLPAVIITAFVLSILIVWGCSKIKYINRLVGCN